MEKDPKGKVESIILAGGCFWCIEAVFQRLKGVLRVTSGYTGGNTKDPTYEQVSSGATGHVEAVRVEFDPSIISLKEILDMFWKAHDPTQEDGQGGDIGKQYCSAAFYGSPKQEEKCLRSLEDTQLKLDKKITTRVLPAKKFYPAEEYHSNFYNNNKATAYCRLVIDPKLNKLKLV